MKEIGVVTTKINLVLENGSVREHTYTTAFWQACTAHQYAGSAQAYKDAYADAQDVLDWVPIRVWFPDSSTCQTLVLQSEI